MPTLHIDGFPLVDIDAQTAAWLLKAAKENPDRKFVQMDTRTSGGEQYGFPPAHPRTPVVRHIYTEITLHLTLYRKELCT